MSIALKRRCHARIGAYVRLRTLLGLLFALAVLFAPAVTGVAAAQAAVPDHQAQMVKAGHCTSTPSGQRDYSDGRSCCISVNVGVAVAQVAPLVAAAPPAPTPISLVRALHRPYLGEIATPPPRLS
jgi:hypothetical protein